MSASGCTCWTLENHPESSAAPTPCGWCGTWQPDAGLHEQLAMGQALDAVLRVLLVLSIDPYASSSRPTR